MGQNTSREDMIARPGRGGLRNISGVFFCVSYRLVSVVPPFHNFGGMVISPLFISPAGAADLTVNRRY